jgi:hypothetical protein
VAFLLGRGGLVHFCDDGSFIFLDFSAVVELPNGGRDTALEFR